MTYEDSFEREEKDLNLHIAKLVEHMEFENELPEAEKHKRRLIRYIQGLPAAAEVAHKNNLPWVLFGQLERMVYHAEAILGKDWIEQARKQRSAWFAEDDDSSFDEDFLFDPDDYDNRYELDDENDDQDFDKNYDPNEDMS